jgi:hypothetical protein
MIKIIRGAEVDGPKGEAAGRRHGTWAYRAPGYPLVCGYSRQPLLDACRQLKSLYGLTGEGAQLFREGRDTPDISCGVDVGAATTVREPANGGIGFVKYVAFSNVFGPEPAAAEG